MSKRSGKTHHRKRHERGAKRPGEGRRPATFSAHHPGATRILFDVACVAALALAVLLVYHRVFRYFFAQDDFTSLWIARQGPATFWRVLSSFVYFRVGHLLFGLNPVAFHTVSLTLHAACGLLVFLVARALSLGRTTSLLCACLFVAHPALYASVCAISSTGEILSCVFVLAAALYLLRAQRPERPGGLLLLATLFAASLLSKETAIFFPILVFFIYWQRRLSLKRALAPFSVLAAVAVAYACLFYRANMFGIREAPAAGEPYVVTLGPALVTSVQTYFKWSLNFLEALKRHPMNVLDEKASVWLVAGAALFAVMLLSRRDRRKSVYCILWFLITLLPVIPLTSHPYHYYLYMPLAGLCPAVGLLISGRLRKTTLEAPISAALLVLFVFNSYILVSRIERATVVDSARRKDPVFDRAIVAGNLITDLRAVGLPEQSRLLLVSPLKAIMEGRVAEHPYLVMGGSYWDTNLRTAIAEGIGVRLFFPQVDTVAFAQEMTPQFEGFTAVGYTWDGHVRTAGQVPAASLPLPNQ